MESLLTEIHVPFLSPTMPRDNLSAVLLSHNVILHVQIKHIELNIHFVRKLIVCQEDSCQTCSAHAQITNTLLKLLDTMEFQSLHTKLKVSCLNSS